MTIPTALFTFGNPKYDKGTVGMYETQPASIPKHASLAWNIASKPAVRGHLPI